MESETNDNSSEYKMAASMVSPSITAKGMACLRWGGFHRTVCCLQHQSKLMHSQSEAHSTNQEVADSNPSSTSMQNNEQDARLRDTLQQDDYFQLKNLVTVRDLFKARAHLGHNAGLRHQTMTPFIFGERLGRDIIDLEQTLPRLTEALNVCAHVVHRGGMVLFLCRNAQVLPWVEKMAREVNEYSHCRPWKSGIFTNASKIFNTLPIYPDLCVFFNTQDTVFEQHKGVVESSKLLIPSIGFVDTNCTVDNVTYPIPANDDTPDCMHLYIDLFRTAVLRGKERRKADGLEDR